MTFDLDRRGARRKRRRDGEGIDLEEGHSDEQELQQDAPAAHGVEKKGRQKARSDPGMWVVQGVLVFPTSVHDESNITLVAARTAHILNR